MVPTESLAQMWVLNWAKQIPGRLNMRLPPNIDANNLTFDPIFAFHILHFEFPLLPIKHKLFYLVLQSILFLHQFVSHHLYVLDFRVYL